MDAATHRNEQDVPAERRNEYRRLLLQLEQAQREGIFASQRIERLESELNVARDDLRTATTATDAIKRELRAITGEKERSAHGIH